MSKYDFALQWLNYLGVTVYNDGIQILKYEGSSDYEISPLTTHIKIGEELGDEADEQKFIEMHFEDFTHRGFVIKGERNPLYFYKTRQNCAYRIVRQNKNTIGLSYEAFRKAKSRNGLTIQNDPARKRFRLLGESVFADNRLRPDSGVGPWVKYDADKPILSYIKEHTSKIPTKRDAKAIMKRRVYGTPIDEQIETMKIKELPVMISDEKYIVCIKQGLTIPRILIVGESGYGKSLCLSGLAGRIRYNSDDCIGWIIDPMNQFNDISLPQDYSIFNDINARIGDEPKPMPAVQLYVACKYPLNITHGNISIIQTLNFEEFLKKYKFYIYGIKDYDVGDTVRYMPDYIEDIKNVNSGEEVKQILFERIPNIDKDKGKQAMAYKWKLTFDTILKEKFTSNMYNDFEHIKIGKETYDIPVSYELEIKKPNGSTMKGHPFIMLMEAGVMAILNTSIARRQRWLRNYLADLMQKIVQHQINRGDNQSRMWIMGDELSLLSDETSGKKKDNCDAAFQELFTQGRFNNIGFIGNTQSLLRLPVDMYKNATHLFCFFVKDRKDRNKLMDYPGVTKETCEAIGTLQEQEMIAFKNPTETWVVYDRWGRRKEIKDRSWFRGRIFPPISHHKIPPQKKETEE